MEFEPLRTNETKCVPMIDRFRHSMQALQLLMRAQEVTANNLANINTPGFKGDKLFYRAFMEELDGRRVASVQAGQTVRMAQGAFESTGNPFDFAIEGEGFFTVEQEGNRFLTRDGRFELDSEGFLTDGNGARVLGESGPVHLPQLIESGRIRSDVEVEVNKHGAITVNGERQDRLSLVRMDDVSALERRSNAYLQAPEGVELAPDDQSQVMQGYYESGNVEPLQELVSMTRNMRLFESQQRAMRTTDEMLSQATNRLGRF